ncbi:MAG: Co2+/Mg2+ efflux protein ApaG [Planctomycetota bacterium]
MTTATTAAPKHGSDTLTEGVRVTVRPEYMPLQSSVREGRFLFSYHIRMVNTGAERMRLASRFWRIVDADGEQRVTEGPGVVGQHPELGPGDSFEYSSFCPLGTPWGTMEGHFVFERAGKPFAVQVGRFFLVS